MGSKATPQQISIPFTYYRGGTSKSLFFHEKDVPSPGPARDTLLKRLMGTPDPMQIDGMGGTHIVTSKISIVQPSSVPGVDVDYTFCQVGTSSDTISYDGNCGNISSAVGPFAIREKLVKDFREGQSADPKIKTQEIKIFNTGTKKVLISHVPITEDGLPLQTGNFEIDGCPGTGAPILMDYKEVVGASRGKGILPTGNAIDKATLGGKEVEYTTCDVANIIVFARAADLGITGDEEPADLDINNELLDKIRELRGKAAQQVGICDDWREIDTVSPSLPMVALISQASNPEGHVRSRLFLNNKCHTSMAGTGAICHTACSRAPDSIVNQMMRPGCEKEATFKIQHPLGLMPVAVATKPVETEGQLPEFQTLSFIRTARRIMKGDIDVPENVQEEFLSAM